MKQIIKGLALVAVLAVLGNNAIARNKVTETKNSYAKEALQEYVESGQLPGAISVLYKDGVQETCCIGYADVESKRPITMNSAFMQCSQTKGFCGVTIAKLVEEGKYAKWKSEAAELFALASLVLAILNLLPISELDGGRIVYCTLASRFSVECAKRVVDALSFAIIFSLWTLSVYLILRLGASLSLFVFSCFLFGKIFIKNTYEI